MSDFLVEQMDMSEDEHTSFLADAIKKNGGIHPPGGSRLVNGKFRFIVCYSDADDRHAEYLGVVTWINVQPSKKG